MTRLPEQVPSVGEPRRRRLLEANDRPRFHPWTRAPEFESCQLYWMPVSSFPIGYLQRQWLLRFQELLRAHLAKKLKLAPEVFLQMNSINAASRDTFISNARRFHPLFGLGRHPGRALPPIPDEKYAEDLQKGRVTYDHNSLRPDYTYWFLEKQAAEQLHLFYGGGGTTTIFLEASTPPPKAQKPRLASIRDTKLREMVANYDMDSTLSRMQAVESPFLKQSKEMFASDLQDDPQYPGLLFTLPLLAANDFFAATPAQVTDWFSLFKLYLRESPEDKGIVMATSEDFEESLDELLQQMQSEGLEYPA